MQQTNCKTCTIAYYYTVRYTLHRHRPMRLHFYIIHFNIVWFGFYFRVREEEDLEQCVEEGLEVCRAEGIERETTGSAKSTKERLRLGDGIKEDLREHTEEPAEDDARERIETDEHDNVFVVDLTREEEHEKVN